VKRHRRKKPTKQQKKKMVCFIDVMHDFIVLA
jgi:hypothetical protein